MYIYVCIFYVRISFYICYISICIYIDNSCFALCELISTAQIKRRS